jgi:hypothetical protein
LWLEAWDYVVVLEKRVLRIEEVVVLEKRLPRIGEVAFLVSAYHVDGDSVRRSLRTKYAKREGLNAFAAHEGAAKDLCLHMADESAHSIPGRASLGK